MREIQNKLANLEIKTFKGVVPCASHYFGYLTFKHEPFNWIDVERKLTFDEMHDLNNVERMKYGDAMTMRYYEGETCRFFLSEDDLIRTAKKMFYKSLRKIGALALVKGDKHSLEAKRILCVGRPEHLKIMRRANALQEEVYKLYKYNEFDDRNVDYKAIDKLEDQWWTIIEELEK